MYSRVDSDVSTSMIMLYTEDFTFVIWRDKVDTNGVIACSVVIINYNGRKTIRTSANVRALADLSNSYSMIRKCACVTNCMFREILDMLPISSRYYIPHSEQTKIMKLLEAVLY